jgi:hypothetical protein
MQFPKAADYYKNNTPILVTDSTIDNTAQLPMFHFGQQPVGFKDIDKAAVNGEDRKIAVIGCGSAYKIFSSTALKQRGTKCYIIDTADKEVIEARLERKLDPEREIKIGSMDELPADVQYVAIFTPPEHHAGDIRKLQARGMPTMVEKPIVPLGSHLTGAGHLDEKLEQHGNAPLYCMDWEVTLATPLMAALGMKPSFEGIVEYGDGGKDAFKAFDINNVTNIETTFVEGGENPLGKKQDRGGWLWDISKGGGGFTTWVSTLSTHLRCWALCLRRIKSAMLHWVRQILKAQGYIKLLVAIVLIQTITIDHPLRCMLALT